jgi:hypothetical protein
LIWIKGGHKTEIMTIRSVVRYPDTPALPVTGIMSEAAPTLTVFDETLWHGSNQITLCFSPDGGWPANA